MFGVSDAVRPASLMIFVFGVGGVPVRGDDSRVVITEYFLGDFFGARGFDYLDSSVFSDKSPDPPGFSIYFYLCFVGVNGFGSANELDEFFVFGS